MTKIPLVGNTLFGLDVSQLGPKLMSLRRRLSKRLLLLEFSPSGLRYAEAVPSLDGIFFSHISRVPLPDEALERGVPSDPALMASLIKALCQEKRIPAHRAAVVLSPDVAYQRTVLLPPDLTADEARAYLLDPANAIPLPFPLEQMDFDVYPLSSQKVPDYQPYLLIAIPQTLIDRVISMLDDAGLELQALELGSFSVLRFLPDELIGLSESELHLVLELLPECSQLCVVSSSGPIRFERLSAIRDFPDPVLDDAQCKAALAAGLSAEEVTLKDERYLPISELDLRAVLRDVKAVITEMEAEADSTLVFGLTLSGINSAHPLIKDLFQEALGCHVKVINPVLMPRVSGFSPDDLLVQASLARLIGLGLSFLPRELLLSCFVQKISPPSQFSIPPSPTVDVVIDPPEQPITSLMTPLDVEATQSASVDLTIIGLEESMMTLQSFKSNDSSVDENGVHNEKDELSSSDFDVEDREESVKPKELSVHEELAQSEEDELSSLDLDVEDREESVKPEELSVHEELAQSEEEELPGIIDMPQNNTSAPLGELRFKDD